MIDFLEYKSRIRQISESGDYNELQLGFLFGLCMRTYKYVNENPLLTKDCVELSHSLFVKNFISLLPDILRTQNGEDDNGTTNIDEKPRGKEEYEYIISRALFFRRPDYCLMFILGMLRGDVNELKINSDLFKIICDIFPKNFFLTNWKLLNRLFVFFNNSPYNITIQSDGCFIAN
jgi:hypothetical protein